jgi:hypothetical protein
MPFLNGRRVSVAEWLRARQPEPIPLTEPEPVPVAKAKVVKGGARAKKDAAAQVMAAMGLSAEDAADTEDDNL